MSGFTPVHLPPDRALNGRASQTFLRHYDGCPRSGFLYATTRGEVRTPEMLRGTALHLIAQRAVEAAIEQGEPTIPPDVVKVIADEVLAEVHVPSDEWDYLRECAWRLASELAVTPSAVVACETLFTLRLGERDVRCRIDFAELADEGAAVLVRDYKSGRGAPTQEEIARVRPDGSLHAKSFQLILYAVVLAFGVPVREEPCGACTGRGYAGEGVGRVPCKECGGSVGTNLQGRQDVMGRGVIEIPEPFPVAARAQRFDLEFAFPGIEDREGRMLRRSTSLTRLEVVEYKSALEGLLARVAQSERTGDWPAVVSDAACGQCPAPQLCPIPVELRDHRGEINTVEQAAEALAVLDREQAEHRARRAEVRNFAKAHGGPIRFGNKVAAFEYSESEVIRDREGLFAAVERAVRFGEPFDRSEFVRVQGRTEFKARDVVADEAPA